VAANAASPDSNKGDNVMAANSEFRIAFSRAAVFAPTELNLIS
jgi:hypothetical protein